MDASRRSPGPDETSQSDLMNIMVVNNPQNAKIINHNKINTISSSENYNDYFNDVQFI